MPIFEIQIFRVLAALMVVLFHTNGLTLIYAKDNSWTYQHLGTFGSYGVDLFFIISGFLMYYTWHCRPQSGREFLRKRMLRIVPIYWLLTLLFFACISTAHLGHLLASLVFGSSLFLAKMPLLYDGWTLEYEVFFYLSLFLIIYQFKRSWFFLISVFFLLIIAGNFFPEAFLLNPLIIEFCLGILAAQICFKAPGSAKTIGLILASVILTFYRQSDHRLLIAGIPAFFLVLMAVRFRLGRFIPRTFRPLVERLSDASYSIYLVQVFTMPLAGKSLNLLWPQAPANFLVGLSFFGTLVAGYLFYLWVEKPLGRKLKNILAPRKSIALALLDVSTENRHPV